MSEPVVTSIAGTAVDATARASSLHVAASRFVMLERAWAPNFLCFISFSIGVVWYFGAPAWVGLVLMVTVSAWLLLSIVSRVVIACGRNSRSQHQEAA